MTQPYRKAPLTATSKRAASPTLRPLAVAIHLALFSLGAGAGGLAMSAEAEPATVSAEARRAYNIPAGPLATRLNRFAQESGLVLSYDPPLATGSTSNGLQGEFSITEGLNRLLAGTGLISRFTGANTVTLEKQADDKVLQLAPITVQGERLSGPAFDPGQGQGYKADVATTATRSALPIQETPASIGVVTSNYIRDSFALTQNEALEQVSGITRNNTRQGRSEGINIRGFAVNEFLGSFSGLKANGLATDGVFAPDPAIVERYEILKGPASITGGASSPGGVINRITKKPLFENFASFEPQVGSFDFYRGVVDANGVLPQNEDLRGRLILAYEDGGNFIDNIEVSQYTLAPSLEADLFDGAATLLLTGQYQNFDGSSDPGFPLLANGEVPDIRRTQNFGGGSDAGAETRFSGDNSEIHYDHEFVNNLKLSAKGKYSRSDLSDKILYAYAPGGIPDDGEIPTSAGLREIDFATYAGEIFLSKEFEALGRRHEALIGVDHRDQTNDFFIGYVYLENDNFFDPANEFEAPSDAVLEAAANVPRHVVLEQTGVFAQVTMRPVERLTLLAAGRYDRADSTFENTRTGATNDQSPSDFTGRVGASFELRPWMNVYASYAESFEPQVFAMTADGSPLPPETGQQYEVGTKFDLLDGRLGITTALFRAFRQNVATDDLDPDAPRDASVATGEQRHQGFELDINGEPWPGLNLVANFSFVDAEITESNDGLEGDSPQRIPKDYTGRVFLTYELQSGALQGLGFGGGVYFQSGFELSLPNEFTTDGYERVDAVIFYRYRDNLNFALNVRNLLDETYIESPGGLGGYNSFGAPLSVFASLRYRFE